MNVQYIKNNLNGSNVKPEISDDANFAEFNDVLEETDVLIENITNSFKTKLIDNGVDIIEQDTISSMITKIDNITGLGFSNFQISIFTQNTEPVGSVGDLWIKENTNKTPIISINTPISPKTGDIWVAIANVEMKTKFNSILNFISDFPNPMIFDVTSGNSINETSSNLLLSSNILDIYATFSNVKRYENNNWVWVETYIKKSNGWVLIKNETYLYMQSGANKLHRYHKNMIEFDRETEFTISNIYSFTSDLEGYIYISTGSDIKKLDLELNLISTYSSGFNNNYSCVDLKGYLYIIEHISYSSNIRINKMNIETGDVVKTKTLQFGQTANASESILFDYINQRIIVNGMISNNTTDGIYILCDLDLNVIKTGNSRIVADGNGGYLGKISSEVSLYDKNMTLIRTAGQVLYDNYRLAHDGNNNVYINGYYPADNNVEGHHVNMNTRNITSLKPVYSMYKYFGDKLIHKITNNRVDTVNPAIPNNTVSSYTSPNKKSIIEMFSNVNDVGAMKILF